MLYAHNQEANKISSILLFLNFVLNGEEKYKEYLDGIISEAVDLVRGEKTIFDISKDNFSIITKLQEYGQESIRSIDKANIEKSDYQNIKEVLEKSSLEMA